MPRMPENAVLPEPLISPGVAAFVASGLSITVAGCGERLIPSIAKAVACRVAPDRRSITMLLFADQAESLCRDIARNGRIAVCFSRPSTHETVQLKGSDAIPVPTTPSDAGAARSSLDRFAADLAPLGWNTAFLDAFFWRDLADLVAIRFTPDGAFAQTPGPSAGAALPP
jgi:hypothetical protein